MNSLTLLHNFLTNATSILNFVLSVELAIACICGLWHGWTIGEATTGKITELGLYAGMLFGAWQYCPHELVLLTVLPQCAFWVFVGGLVGCTFRWVFEQTVARN